MGWQDAPIIQEGTPSVTPAWMKAPIEKEAGTPNIPPAPKQPATAHADEDFDEHSPIDDVISMVKAIPSGVVQLVKNSTHQLTSNPLLGLFPALQAAPEVADALHKLIADPSGTISSIGSTLRNATPEQVGRNVAAPIVAGGAATGLVRGAAGVAGAAAEGAGSDAAALGFRTAEGPGASLAGDTAGPTLDAQNQRVAQNVLGADAGVPHTKPVNASTLEDARKAPGDLLNAGYDQVQPGPLSPAARQQVLDARGAPTITRPTPNVATQINDIESSLLDPNGQFTGPQLRATRNSLNSDATAGANSADADTRTVAAYKRRVVSALDQHVVDSTPPGAPVTSDQLSNARSTLGKNYQLQDLIGKGGDLNLQKLAQIHRDNPNLLTGPTRTVAQFASDHPEVTGAISDADRISPPSFMGDVGNLNVFHPLSSVGRALFGAVGRSMLTGNPLIGRGGTAIGQAMRTPVAGLGGEFIPSPPGELPFTPPAGQVGNAPVQRSIPLSPGRGLPFNPPLGLQPPAGAPIVPQQYELGEPNVLAGRSTGPIGGGNQRGSFSLRNINRQLEVPDNGNPENPASVEANNRGTGNFVHWNGDSATPILADATQIDKLTPPKGSITIDANTGKVVSSGNTPRNLVQGLLARWQMHRPLGDTF